MQRVCAFGYYYADATTDIIDRDIVICLFIIPSISSQHNKMHNEIYNGQYRSLLSGGGDQFSKKIDAG